MGKILDAILGPSRDLAAAPPPAAISAASSGVIDGIASPPEWSNRENFAQITLEHLLGNPSLVPVNRTTAMSVAALDRAVQVVTGVLMTTPLVYLTGGQRNPRAPYLVTQPEIGTPRSSTMRHIGEDLCLFGRAYLEIVERDAPSSGGRPRRFKFWPNEDVTTDANGRVTHLGQSPVRNADVVRIDGPHDGWLNRPKRIREAIAIDMAAEHASSNPVPSIDLHQTGGTAMTEEQIDRMISRWAAARRGQNGGIGYTNQAVEARAMGQAAEQLLIDGRNQTALNIARMANMPAWQVDASVSGSSLTYSNVPSRSRELIDYTLSPYFTAIVDRFGMNDLTPATDTLRFDTSAMLQGNLQERATTYKTLVDSGVFSAEECRRYETTGSFLEESNK